MLRNCVSFNPQPSFVQLICNFNIFSKNKHEKNTTFCVIFGTHCIYKMTTMSSVKLQIHAMIIIEYIVLNALLGNEMLQTGFKYFPQENIK